MLVFDCCIILQKSFGYEKGNKFGEITYTYDSKNRLTETYNSLNDLTTKIEYGRFGRVDHMQRSDGVSSDLTYDNFRNLVSKSVLKLFDISQTLTNTFGKGNLLSSSSIQTNNSTILSKYGYDDIARLQNSDVLTSDESSGIRHEITYEDFDQDRTTGLISSVEIKNKANGNWTNTGEKFNYTYDNLGNITSVTDAVNLPIATYVYDTLNQLVRENNSQTGKTVTYEYNAGGNLTEKKIYSYTTDSDLTNATLENTITYTYGDSNWADKLASYNGQDIVYDAIGNPLEYRGWEFEWSRGKRLDKAVKTSDNINVSYKYDENGIRTQKTINGVTTDFITSGIKVLAQKSGNNTLVWQVDGNGNTVGFNYNGTPYFYMKNLQGDIIGITDTSGDIVAKYTYNSWGKLISIKDLNDVDRTTDENFIGYINPIRYRGYYYDSEIGLYYLNARYYDPETGKFINSDWTLAGGYNLFEYCLNNPVNLSDEKGCDPHPPGYKFRTNDPWEVYWEAGQYVQTQTINDIDDVEYAFVVYKDTDEQGDYYSYDVERGNPRTGLVDPTRLINTYLKTGKCPDRLFGHTHGKDPRDGIRHYNKYSDGDYIAAESEKIFLGLFPPDGTAQMYDGRSGRRTRAYFMNPPENITIPKDPYYEGFWGYFRRLRARAQY